MINLSIIIPVYNSCNILEKLINEIKKNLNPTLEKNYELILVNDNSRDNSWDEIEKLSKSNSNLKGINLKYNIGQHGSIFVGLKYSKGKKIIIMDDDLQHPPKSLISINDKLDRFDACYTLYKNRQHARWKIIISVLNNIFSSFLFNKKFNIYLSSMKGIRSETKETFINNLPKKPFIDSLILKGTKKITNIEVNHQERFEGRSNYDLKKLLILWFDMIENFHFYPLRFGSFIGLIAFCFVKLIRIFKSKNKFSYTVLKTTF